MFSSTGTSLFPAHALQQNHSGLDSALGWLLAHQASDGSYGAYFEGQTAAAAYALWLNDSTSHASTAAYDYLGHQLNDSSTWFWGPYGEADIPGEVLFSNAITHNLATVNTSAVQSRLLAFQTQSGGFAGFFEVDRTVTSSVDTAMALWGLANAGLVPETNRTAAINYLLTLQNPEGNFNLTRTTIENSYSSLGPDKIAITAVVLLALREAGFNPGSPSIEFALEFLSLAAWEGFSGPGHVYDAALSLLAFLQYYHPHEAAASLTYLMAQQNSDGGFSDASRSSPSSNALDTGWAAVALQYAIRRDITIQGSVNQPPKAIFSFNPQNPKNGTSVSFDAGSSYDSDGDHLQYDWTFGDGKTASGQKVTHSYSQSGTYTVTLTVIDSGTNPNQLTGTTWSSLTVESFSTSHAATQPQTNSLSLEAGIAVLAVAVIIGGYLVTKTNKKRLAKIEPFQRV